MERSFLDPKAYKVRRIRLRTCEMARNTNYYKDGSCVSLLACLAVRVTSGPGVAKKNTAGRASSDIREHGQMRIRTGTDLLLSQAVS